MEGNSFHLFPNNRIIDIDFDNVTYDVKQRGEKKRIIKGVSGKFLSGELTAIMGPSGAGKTTLLNILTGMQAANATGTINGNQVSKNGGLRYKKDSCYILQDDNLPHLFTVLEMMTMAADLKLRNISEKAKDFLIHDILDNLGLKVCMKTRCQYLSGGQRKRLSVALELINNPPIMFLDEPTTGLDSSSSAQCVQLLKNLALGRRTIICTIHQPSAIIYEKFDHIFMMADGYCVYQGSSTNTIPYLSSLGLECPQYNNPADYFLEVVNGEYGNFTEVLTNVSNDEKWRDSPKIENKKESEEINSLYPEVYYNEMKNVNNQPPSEWTRFWILLYRCVVQIFRDWTISQLRLVLHTLVGIFLGLTFRNCGQDAEKTHENLGFLLIGIVYLTYTSLMPAVLKFPSELPILKKERFNNWYKLKTYFAAFLLSDVPIQATFSIAYTVTSYFISGQPVEWRRFLMVLVIQILVTLTASSFGLVLGTIVNPVNGTFWGAITLATMICGSGFLIFFTHMSKIMYFLTYISFTGYALEGVMQSIYGYSRAPLECAETSVYCHYTDPEVLLEDIGMAKPTYWFDVAYLFSIFIILRWTSFYTLKRSLSKV